MGKRTTTNWSNEEDEFLIQNYKKMTDKDIGMVLNRTEAGVRLHRLDVGLTKYNSVHTKPRRIKTEAEVAEEIEALMNKRAAIDIVKLLSDIISGKVRILSSNSEMELGEFHKLIIEFQNSATCMGRGYVDVNL